MARGSFFDDNAKTRVTETIRAIEGDTAAEVVVVVRPHASRYLLTSVAFAGACALVALSVMWFSPIVYDVRTIPIDTALTFVVTLAFAVLSDVVRGRFTPPSIRHRRVRAAAEGAFQELGIARTSGRTGLLVFVTLLEREVLILADQGIDESQLGSAYEQTKEALRAAVQRRDIDAFVTALGKLRAPLAALLPRLDDDVNELSDHVA